jgi:hypothetical protein
MGVRPAGAGIARAWWEVRQALGRIKGSQTATGAFMAKRRRSQRRAELR